MCFRCNFHCIFQGIVKLCEICGKMEEMKNVKQRFALSAVCGSLILLAFACGPKASTSTDQALTTAIQSRLYANEVTHAANVKVAVADGVVTLSGDVPSADVALQAMTVANGTAGIRSVANQMKVQPSTLADSSISPDPMRAQPAAAPSQTPLPQQLQTPPPPPSVAPPPPPPTVPVPVVDGRPEQHEEMVRRGDERHDEPAAPPKPRTITIAAGRSLSIRMIDGIDTGHNQEGQTFRASLSAPITDDDRVIVPAGTLAIVLLAESRGAGRIKGQSELELRVTSITYHGEPVRVATSSYEAKGSARGKESAIRTGIGAAAGALIGGLAGGGKGAGIGAAAGGGAGVGYQLLTHGKQIKIPSETQIDFRLEAPLVLTR
jgi:hypothetical protein